MVRGTGSDPNPLTASSQGHIYEAHTYVIFLWCLTWKKINLISDKCEQPSQVLGYILLVTITKRQCEKLIFLARATDFLQKGTG